MKFLIALLLLAPLGIAQSAEPDLSVYGSLARQQVVRENLRLHKEKAYLDFRRKIREQLPTPTRVIYTRPRAIFVRYESYNQNGRTLPYVAPQRAGNPSPRIPAVYPRRVQPVARPRNVLRRSI